MREAAAGRGEDLNTLPRQYAKLINECIKDHPKDMTIGLHLCRGNFRSTHFAEGGYEPIAEVLFKEVDVDVYFLEFDDDRSGNFEPLRFLPKGKTVILGLVSSKVPELESKDSVVARIKEASKYAPLEQLGLSAQCGFASTKEGNNVSLHFRPSQICAHASSQLSQEEQWAKMRLIGEVVEEVWGKK